MQLGLRMNAFGDHEQRVRRPERDDRATLGFQCVGAHRAVDRQHERVRHLASGTLRRHVELAQVHDLVAPELRAHRIRHAEAVDVEDAAAHAELRDVLHHRHTLEADALQVLDQLREPVLLALAQLDAQVAKRPRHPGALEQRTRRRDQESHLAAHRVLERLDPFTGHLHVRLGFAESFARRIQAHDVFAQQRAKIREPSFRIGQRLRDDYQEPAGHTLGERGDRGGVRRAGQPGDATPLAGSGEAVGQASESRETLDRFEQQGQRHDLLWCAPARACGDRLRTQHEQRRDKERQDQRSSRGAAERETRPVVTIARHARVRRHDAVLEIARAPASQL